MIIATFLFSLVIFVPAVLLYEAIGWEYPNLGPIANLGMAFFALFLLVPVLGFLFFTRTGTESN